MPSPFPGMDPYLEHPELWPGVHHRLIVAIADLLSVRLRPKYSVSLEVRMYEVNRESPVKSEVAVASPTKPINVTLPMPITVRQGYLEVKEVASREFVTALEILSPANKRSGKGRDVYLAKRERILDSRTNFVEIDLLRAGDTMPILNKGISSDYRILASRGDRRPQADLYAFNLKNTISSFLFPLRSQDSEPVIDIQTLLNNIYDVGSYDLKIDYAREPIPPLSEEDYAWADAILRERELR